MQGDMQCEWLAWDQGVLYVNSTWTLLAHCPKAACTIYVAEYLGG